MLQFGSARLPLTPHRLPFPAARIEKNFHAMPDLPARRHFA